MKWINEYHERVESGQIIVCESMQLQINRVKRFIDKYEYDSEEVANCIGFIENCVKHFKGSFANKPFHLSLWQKYIISVCFGFYEYIDKEVVDVNGDVVDIKKERRRLTTKCFIEVARKNGKSMFGSALALYMMLADGEDSPEVYLLANTLKQVNETIYKTVLGILSKNKDLSKYFIKRRTDLELKASGTLAPLASDSNNLDGLNPSYALFDECLNKEVEVLTTDGWKTIDTVTTDDKVVQWNKDYSLEFVHPTRTVKKYCETGFKVSTNNGKDYMFQSSNHRNPVINSTGNFHVRTASELRPSHNYVNCGQIKSNRGKLTPEEKLLIMIQADGSVAKDSKTIAQIAVKKERKIIEIEKLMRENPQFNFKEVKSRDEYRRWTLNIRFHDFKDKKFNNYFNIEDFDYDKANEFIEYLKHWDYHQNIRQDFGCYCSTDKENVDFVQQVATLCGYQSNITVSNDNRKKSYKTYYRLYLKKRNKGRAFKSEPVEINDYLYCLTVPSSFFVIRVNGRVMVTGNCHEFQNDNLIEVIESGLAARENPMLMFITSNGMTRGKVFDNLVKYYKSILRGKIEDDNTAIFIFEQDSEEEIKNEQMWIKSNPNLKISVDFEYLRRRFQLIYDKPENKNSILSKNFCIPQNSSSVYFTVEQSKMCETINIDELMKGSYGTFGVDLSMNRDLTVLTYLFEREKIKYIKQWYFLPKEILDKKIQEDKVPYNIWAEQGHLILLEGDYINVADVFDFMIDKINEFELYPQKIGFDRYYASDFLNKTLDYFGDYMPQAVIQGLKTRSPILNELKVGLDNNTIVHNNPMLEWNLLNVTVVMDKNENVDLDKRNKLGRVDGVDSLIDAFHVWNEFSLESNLLFNE